MNTQELQYAHPRSHLINPYSYDISFMDIYINKLVKIAVIECNEFHICKYLVKPASVPEVY